MLSKTNDNYQVFAPIGVTGQKENRWVSDALKRHAEQKRVIVTAANVEHFVDMVVASGFSTNKPSYTVSHARCARAVDLSATSHESCTVLFDGKTVTYSASISPTDGLNVRRTVAVLNNHLVAARVQSEVSNRLEQATFKADVTVDCGSGISVLKPGAQIVCKLYHENKSATVSVFAIDTSGKVRFYVSKPS